MLFTDTPVHYRPNLITAIRYIDEYDILGIIHAIVTKEIDYSDNQEFLYGYKDVYQMRERIKETFGANLITDLDDFIKFLKDKFYCSCEELTLEKGIVPKGKMVIERKPNKQPDIAIQFDSMFVLEELFEFYNINRRVKRCIQYQLKEKLKK